MALNYTLCAVIWTAALAITPIVWAVDELPSQFSGIKGVDQVNGATAEK